MNSKESQCQQWQKTFNKKLEEILFQSLANHYQNLLFSYNLILKTLIFVKKVKIVFLASTL